MASRDHGTIGRNAARVVVVCLLLLTTGGCAVKQAFNSDPRDPWEGYNRYVFSFNESVDMIVIKPVAEAYQAVLPEPVRRGVSNVFSNLGDLPNALNNLLQGDVSGSAGDVLRFMVNSTVGVFGLFDPAAALGLDKSEEDFGQTLAVWGVGSGPYFMLPVLGPSTLRDFPGRIVDFLIYPVNLVNDSGVRISMQLTRGVSDREGFLEQEKILRELSPDVYQQIKGFYLNNRDYLVRDGAVVPDDELYEEIEE